MVSESKPVHSERKRLKVLLSAYACEPDRGSEPGVGWGWALSLARLADVTVVTRANNQEKIEAWIERQGGRCEVRFLYYDPPKIFLWLKRRGLPVNLFYLVWQMGVRRRIRPREEEFDLVHHVTFNSMMLPGLWWRTKVPVVLGPLGGTSRIRKDYKKLFGRFLLKEQIRELLIRNWRFLLWVRRSFQNARLILCANSQTARTIGAKYETKTRLLLETGIYADRLRGTEPVALREGGEIRIIWIGTIEPWKAPTMAINGFARALRELPKGVECILDVVGEGRQKAMATALVEKLGIADRVIFHGWVAQEQAHEMIRSSAMLLFSSVKDTSGNVVLEAMAQGIPVICLNHQGVADITTDETAIRVAPGTVEETEAGISDAIVSLALNPDRRVAMGEAGLQRLREHYVWERKAEMLLEHYHGLFRASNEARESTT